MPWSQTLEHTGAKSWELLAQQGTRPPELPSQGQTCHHPGQGQTLLTDLSQISPPCTESTMTLKGVLPMDPLLGQTGQRPWLLNSDAGCHTEKQMGSWKPQKRTHFPSSQASFSGQDPLPVFKKTYTMGRILVRIRLGDDSVTNNLPNLSGLQSQRFLALWVLQASQAAALCAMAQKGNTISAWPRKNGHQGLTQQ